MSLSTGSRLGAYEIVAPIGSGGMGEVYRARDTRLDRSVAIKVLPPHLANDAHFEARFEREAKVISGLNHPNICTLHDVGRENGTRFMVMELIEGETLADRLMRGAVPLKQVFTYAIQIADALDKAHRAGIVHRDLKPGNVMITSAGIKLLDFGLAKPGQDAHANDDSDVVTEARPLTEEGRLLGTVPYMAPEQLEGNETDSRTDLFALGAVLYEMVTGRRAFQGSSRASLISAIMSQESPLPSALKTATPKSLDHLIAKCLEKSPEDRWQNARDVTTELQWISTDAATTKGSNVRPGRMPWVLAGAMATLALASFATRPPAPDERTLRFEITTDMNVPGSFAISPDGAELVYTTGEGLKVRSLDSFEAKLLPGTQGASSPFWSPEGRTVGFVSQREQMRKIDIDRGAPVPIGDVGSLPFHGATWNDDGTILFGPANGPIQQVASGGGEPSPATVLDGSVPEQGHLEPVFLPGGRRFLYLGERTTADFTGIFVGSLDEPGLKKLVLDADGPVVFAPPGHILFLREDNLFAQAFDVDALETRGEPALLAQAVLAGNSHRWFAVDVSHSGVLAYRTQTMRQLVWFDRSGRELDAVSEPGPYIQTVLSPDERKVAATGVDATGSLGIVVIDLERNVSAPVTFHAAREAMPVWGPDSDRLVFLSNRDGAEDLFRTTTSNAGDAEPVYRSAISHKHPNDWSPDGRYLLFDTINDDNNFNLWILPVEEGGAPTPFLETRFDVYNAQFSPDGRFVAFVSTESGRNEVYVTDFPEHRRKWRISTDGGTLPQWRADGAELYYVDGSGGLFAVDFRAVSTTESEVGVPRLLFPIPMGQVPDNGYPSPVYDVTGDGERFLINVAERAEAPIKIVVNWQAQLETPSSPNP